MPKETDSNQVIDTETRIMRAAELEFMDKGFAGARTTSIAEAAGVTHAMFHYYFRTKEKLFNRILSEKIDMLRELLMKSFEDLSLPLEDLLRNLINLHLDFISGTPGLPRFLLIEILRDPEKRALFTGKIREMAPKVLSVLQKKIDTLAERGECRKVDVRMLMLDILSLNVLPFIAAPMINGILDNMITETPEFIELRKKEIFDTIMRKLKP